jgi:hypothetical protein
MQCWRVQKSLWSSLLVQKVWVLSQVKLFPNITAFIVFIYNNFLNCGIIISIHIVYIVARKCIITVRKQLIIMKNYLQSS